MNKRYEQFNEVTFEAYIKAAIDKSVMKVRSKKSVREGLEQTFSMLSDAILYTLAADETAADRVELDYRMFDVRGIKIPVYGQALGQAIAYLMPRDREIVLLHFFLGLTDQKISKVVGVSRATVQRRRTEALEKLQNLLEGIA